MLQFVVEQGAGGDPAYVDSLVQFHELMVNPRVRRLRESNFRNVCGVKSPVVRLYLLKAAYGCPATLVRDGWIDYLSASQMSRMGTGKEDLFIQAEQLYTRFHVTYEAAGVWRHARDGKRQLHMFDVEVGRLLLSREGYVGSAQELTALAGSFDQRARSNLTVAQSSAMDLPEPLPFSGEKNSSSGGIGGKRHKASALTASAQLLQPMQGCSAKVEGGDIAWAHVPDEELERVMRDKCRVLLALALASEAAALPGVEEIRVTRVGNVMAVCTCRPFQASSLVLFPMVLGY
jgi:hypothetical protein